MGECLIVRRGGESYELPVLDASYPKDAAVTASPGGSASFSVHITTPGRPAEYTYQWYKNGAAVSGANAATLTLTALTAVATYSVYCKVTNKAGSVSSRTATLTVRSYLPAYTYTGSHQLIDDGNYNWRLKLLTSGTLTFSHLGSGASAVDAFLVGGGGGGAGSPYGNYGGGGGGGGYTRTETRTVTLTAYSIVIGAGGSAGDNSSNGGAGGTTSAFGVTASGGMGGPGGHNEFVRGANGGSGGGCSAGVGGSDGLRRRRQSGWRHRPAHHHPRIRRSLRHALRGRRRGRGQPRPAGRGLRRGRGRRRERRRLGQRRRGQHRRRRGRRGLHARQRRRGRQRHRRHPQPPLRRRERRER